MLPSPSRLFSSRRHAAILRRDVDLVSLDVFGLALRRMVLDPDDVHLLVATLLADGDDDLHRRYPALRAEAERQARDRQGAGVGIADIADILEELLTGLEPATGTQRARRAIRHELEIERLICRPDPEGAALYEEASHRGIPVAFVADSYLPRDLVAKLLLAARYRSDDVLVSSHEGELKANGLLARLARRTGTAPNRVVHVGPDEIDDVAWAVEAGMRGHAVVPGRTGIVDRLVLGFTDRSGLDSVGLALAADRMTTRPEVLAADEVGYVTGGPLVCGFVAWVVGRILTEDPDHVVFHGPTTGFLHQVALTLHPELSGARLHRFDPETGNVEELCRSIGVDDGERVLLVDLGWSATSPTVAEDWDRIGRLVRVDHAVIGAFDTVDPALDPSRCWAFSPGHGHEVREAAAQRIEILEALLGTHQELEPEIGDGLRAGVLRFAEDFQPWLRLGRHHTTAALAEPALRLVLDPDSEEARLLAGLASRETDDDGAVLPLVDPSVPAGFGGDDPGAEVGEGQGVAAGDRAGGRVVWVQGHRALTSPGGRDAPTRRTRRLSRRG